LRLSIPVADDAPRLLAYNERNRDHLRPFSPPEPRGTRDLSYWSECVERLQRDFLSGSSVPLRIKLKSEPDGPVVGAVNLTQIVRGPFCACYVGYHLDFAQVGQGVMSEALRVVVRHAFARLGLHRLMANYVPTNQRSASLLARQGFIIEGYAREYLFIDGAWRDHVLTSLTNRELASPSGSGR
jgi:ribosomal-protein-alanine N-acetyltransferase